MVDANSQNQFLSKKMKIEAMVKGDQKEILFKTFKIKREKKNNTPDPAKIRKLIKNKISAKKSRLRKKERIKMLEAKVIELESKIKKCTKINIIGDYQDKLIDKVIVH